jgi:polyhydroxybutyrate depolymerase
VRGTRAGNAVLRLIVTTTLVLVATSAASCSPGPTPRAVPVVSRKVDPSPGCGDRVLRNAVPPGRERAEALSRGAVAGTYDISVPPAYRPGRPSALILGFYGFDSDPTQFSALTGLPARGSSDDDIVVVPHTQGTESEWQLDAHGTDAAFVDGLVESLEASYCIDQRAIFAAGFSAGAAFAIIYSCARQDHIAAIATVAVEFQLGCTRPMSILAFHGTKDPLVPYQNGAIGLSLPGVKVRGTQLNMGDWARLDRCRVVPLRTRIGSQVTRQQWSGCAPGTSVVLYTVVGGGHSWPGADPNEAVGLTTQQVSATAQILAFFNRHRD